MLVQSFVNVPTISVTEESSRERPALNLSSDLKENYKIKVKKIMPTYQGAKAAETAAHRSALDFRSISVTESKVAEAMLASKPNKKLINKLRKRNFDESPEVN